jgi:tRNA(Ile)-lysidine synthase
LKTASSTGVTTSVSGTTALVTAQLADFFSRHHTNSCLVAYSGGLDSHVLLHALVQLQQDQQKYPELICAVRAVHIDHGLQAQSAGWAVHCRAVCAALNIPLEVVTLNLQVPPGSSLEAVARTARYTVFEQHLRSGEALLTAHHQDDQAETLLLNLLRGSGPDGLAAMPEARPFVNSVLLRPLLGLSRAQLTDYAMHYQLDWIDDPSNESRRFDRNYLRHEILPVLRSRWPAAERLLARAAQWQSEAVELQSELLAAQLSQVQGTQAGTLSVNGLLSCSGVLRKALLRQWLKQAGFTHPPLKKLQHILSDVLAAKPDAQPCVSWDGCEVRRYRDNVYALAPLAEHDTQQVLPWVAPYDSLFIDTLNISLDKQLTGALLPELLKRGEPLQVRFRRGGEKLQRGAIHISLKQWLQDKGIPPWQRERLPLVYLGGQLLLVPGLFELALADLQAGAPLPEK